MVCIKSLKDRLLEGYDVKLNKSGISGERLAHRLDQLSKIGLTEDYGSFRLGLSPEEKEAKELVKKWMREAGLTVTEDGAGNVLGKLIGKNPTLPSIMSGSHVDSVPNGGHFDGPLGVLSALEVVEAWKELDYLPPQNYEVAIFTDEEGSRFNGGLTGSRAFMGEVDYEAQMKKVDADGKSFSQALEEYGSSVDQFLSAKRDPKETKLFVEIHIEQGKRLEKANLPVGIVSGIAGPCWLEVTFTGEAGHAGNTPMYDRSDALIAASEFIAKVETLPEKISSTAVATTGKIHVKPNGINVIPGEVTMYVDIRDINENTRDELVGIIIELAKEISTKRDIPVKTKQTLRIQPIPIQENIKSKLELSLSKHHIDSYHLPSGAGHDAMILGKVVPVAMLFVRSKDGISHNPKEWSTLNDCVLAIHILKDFIENMMDT
jgi:allantoate deiminase